MSNSCVVTSRGGNGVPAACFNFMHPRARRAWLGRIRQQYGINEGTPSPPRRRTPASRRLAFDDDEPRSALEELAAAPLREEDALRTSATNAAPPLRRDDALTTSATSVRSGPVWRFE